MFFRKNNKGVYNKFLTDIKPVKYTSRGGNMSIFDIFKKKKSKSLWDEMMDSPELKAQKDLYDVMSEMNKSGCTSDEIPEGVGEFGLEPTNPIPVNTVQGSILYLGGLRAPDGARVNNERLGSLQVQNIQKPIDEYLITHENGNELAVIYISPYQAKNSKKAPKGFKQVSPLL